MVLSQCFVWKYHVQVFSILEIVHPLHTISNAAIACLTPNPTLARASVHHNINYNQEYSNLEQACVEEVGPLPSSRSCVKHDGTPRPLLWCLDPDLGGDQPRWSRSMFGNFGGLPRIHHQEYKIIQSTLPEKFCMAALKRLYGISLIDSLGWSTADSWRTGARMGVGIAEACQMSEDVAIGW